MDVAAVTADLIAEQDDLDTVVAPLSDDAWALATPSPGWSVADQIGHLTYFDRTAALAIVNPDAFIEHRDQLIGLFDDPSAVEALPPLALQAALATLIGWLAYMRLIRRL